LKKLPDGRKRPENKTGKAEPKNASESENGNKNNLGLSSGQASSRQPSGKQPEPSFQDIPFKTFSIDGILPSHDAF